MQKEMKEVVERLRTQYMFKVWALSFLFMFLFKYLLMPSATRTRISYSKANDASFGASEESGPRVSFHTNRRSICND